MDLIRIILSVIIAPVQITRYMTGEIATGGFSLLCCLDTLPGVPLHRALRDRRSVGRLNGRV
ncbi:hypothetical protein ROLI_030000 [Roseobacter fucihabitans]|uniref:Uncharacterized protein n=1 Tax=Roseobacter fucihabitans TaxID=1537242 RepID=A0ABZ2BWS6_9RHOB|nr:hypothetical protein [Roseobacter litoralis]